jgi:hypothetical protein
LLLFLLLSVILSEAGAPAPAKSKDPYPLSDADAAQGHQYGWWPGAPSFRPLLAEGGVVDFALDVDLVFAFVLVLKCHPERSGRASASGVEGPLSTQRSRCGPRSPTMADSQTSHLGGFCIPEEFTLEAAHGNCLHCGGMMRPDTSQQKACMAASQISRILFAEACGKCHEYLPWLRCRTSRNGEDLPRLLEETV